MWEQTDRCGGEITGVGGVGVRCMSTDTCMAGMWWSCMNDIQAVSYKNEQTDEVCERRQTGK